MSRLVGLTRYRPHTVALPRSHRVMLAAAGLVAIAVAVIAGSGDGPARPLAITSRGSARPPAVATRPRATPGPTQTTAGPVATAPVGVTTTASTASTPGQPPPGAAVAATTMAAFGGWTPVGRPVDGAPVVWTTSVVPPGGGVPVGVARMETARLQVVLYAGTTEPGGTWPDQGAVPAALIPRLETAFNGGFQFRSSRGGFYAGGRAQPPLVDGAASLVTYRDGHAAVAQWGRDATLGPDVTAVRQNLTLLVDNGAPTPAAADTSQWGSTITRSPVTWRSGVGSDRFGDLYFVGGPGLTPASLAAVLVAAGAQRAMELDINPQWVLFAVYSDVAPRGGDLLASMRYPADHFFSADWRDFVAVFEPGSAAPSRPSAPPTPSTSAPPTSAPATTTSSTTSSTVASASTSIPPPATSTTTAAPPTNPRAPG